MDNSTKQQLTPEALEIIEKIRLQLTAARTHTCNETFMYCEGLEDAINGIHGLLKAQGLFYQNEWVRESKILPESEYLSPSKERMIPASEVARLTFGKGEVQIIPAREQNEAHNSLLMFRRDDNPKPVGTLVDNFKGKLETEVDNIAIRIKFENESGIDTLIESLYELRESFTGKRASTYTQSEVDAMVKGLSKAINEAETHLTIPMEPSIALHWVRQAKQILSTLSLNQQRRKIKSINHDHS